MKINNKNLIEVNLITLIAMREIEKAITSLNIQNLERYHNK